MRGLSYRKRLYHHLKEMYLPENIFKFKLDVDTSIVDTVFYIKL